MIGEPSLRCQGIERPTAEVFFRELHEDLSTRWVTKSIEDF